MLMGLFKIKSMNYFILIMMMRKDILFNPVSSYLKILSYSQQPSQQDMLFIIITTIQCIDQAVVFDYIILILSNHIIIILYIYYNNNILFKCYVYNIYIIYIIYMQILISSGLFVTSLFGYLNYIVYKNNKKYKLSL